MTCPVREKGNAHGADRRDRRRQVARQRAGRDLCVQGNSLCRTSGRREPLHAAAAGRALGRAARRAGLSRTRATMAGGADPATGDGDVSRPGGHDSGDRGLPDPACLDARPRCRQAPGHGVAAWRRVSFRLGQPRGHRRRQSGVARRRCRGQRQPPPEHPRPSPPRRSRRRALCPFRQCRRARPDRRARMGARQYRAVRRRSRQCHDLRRVGRRPIAR